MKKAVREAASLSAEEAKKLNVINFIALDNNDLLKKINGLTVKIANSEKNHFHVGLKIESSSPDWRYLLLSFITDPNIAYILMLIAVYGLFLNYLIPVLFYRVLWYHFTVI